MMIATRALVTLFLIALTSIALAQSPRVIASAIFDAVKAQEVDCALSPWMAELTLFRSVTWHDGELRGFCSALNERSYLSFVRSTALRVAEEMGLTPFEGYEWTVIEGGRTDVHMLKLFNDTHFFRLMVYEVREYGDVFHFVTLSSEEWVD